MIVKAKRVGTDELVDVTVDDDFLCAHALFVTVHGYVCFTARGRTRRLGRWVLGLSDDDPRWADHRNRNRLDNRRENLRPATPTESAVNRVMPSTSGLRGVQRTASGRWRAYAPRKALGTYDTAEEAARVAHDWRVANLPGYTDTEVPA